jgi:hypothetical protein
MRFLRYDGQMRGCFRTLALIVAAVFCGVGVIPGRATTLAPMDFDTQVRSAELIFLGVVSEVENLWVPGREGKTVMTRVTFRPENRYKGEPGQALKLDFLGGTIGDTETVVSSMPRFVRGERCVVFVGANRRAVCPLVGWQRGRKRVIETAPGQVFVELDGTEPAGKMARSTAAGAAPGQSFAGLAEFEGMLRERIAGNR